MSGDVQPRKRKDKKRKKEDSFDAAQPPQFTPPPAANIVEDLNIHVHKEEGTGGGICAKVVFFLLFSALAVVIGLIITEHRGLTDLDTVDTESRFAQIFEGWTDPSHDDHDDIDHIANSLEEHEEESHEGDEHEDEEHDHGVEEDEEHSEAEDEEQEEEDDDEEQTVESEEDVASKSEAEEDQVSEETQNTDEDELEEEPENDSNVVDNSVEDEEQEEDEEEIEEDEERSNDDDEEPQVSEEQSKSVEQADEDEEKSAEQEEDATDKPNSEEIEETEKVNEEEGEADNKREEEDVSEEKVGDETQDLTKMVVKIGVGVALLVVAHVVLVRKWKSDDASTSGEAITVQKDETPDLSRRNTIVIPSAYQDIEIEQDINDNGEEEYTDEDEGESEEEPREEIIKAKYQELRSTYTRTLTPDSEPEEQPKQEDEEEYDDDEVEEEEEEGDEDDIDEGEYVEEVEEGESDEGSEKDDEDLLKRLEAKYGKLNSGTKEDDQFSSWKRVNVRDDGEDESDSDRQSDTEVYEYENITSKDDWKIKEKIDEAQKNIQNNAAYAIKLFDVLLEKNPSSPRCHYGRAAALDLLADQERSNELLQQAISAYLRALSSPGIPGKLFHTIAERCINRMRFIGQYSSTIAVHNQLIERFPADIGLRNDLAVSLLTMNRVLKAKAVLEETLQLAPNDGFALVHYGFVLKTSQNNLKDSISFLKRGIASGAPGVIDGRFFFQLGDALARLGRTQEAAEVYEEGVRNGLFRSRYQRSLYNVARLKAQPWWGQAETPYGKLFAGLETNWEAIRAEGLAVLRKNGLFQSESENLKDTGDWKQYELFARGRKHDKHCKTCPITCRIIESVSDASGCKRGQAKFSVMHPGTHVWPHCGPTNCRLRVHLGLQVPPNTHIRVAEEIRSWENGKVLVFDDSFEHEVWHNGSSVRLVLIVDVWHPELTAKEKRNLSPI